MSIWIRCFCRTSLDDVTVADLAQALEDADFLTWGEDVGLDEDTCRAVQRATRFTGPDGPLRVATLHYRTDAPAPIGLERWSGDSAREEITETLDMLEDLDGPGIEQVREVVAASIETVGFELKASDTQHLGWPIAWATAMWLAERGDGLVDAEGQWWDPDTWDIVCDNE